MSAKLNLSTVVDKFSRRRVFFPLEKLLQAIKRGHASGPVAKKPKTKKKQKRGDKAKRTRDREKKKREKEKQGGQIWS
jgi:hypothetical protein